MKKNAVKINENTLRQIVAESVKKVIKEYGYDAVPYSGYEEYDTIGERAAYWVMDKLRNDSDLDSECIARIIDGFTFALRALVDVGDIDNGVKGFGIKL